MLVPELGGDGEGLPNARFGQMRRLIGRCQESCPKATTTTASPAPLCPLQLSPLPSSLPACLLPRRSFRPGLSTPPTPAMPALDAETDVFSPRFLSSNGPGPAAAPRRSPSRQSLAPTPRKSSASLRSGPPSSLADAFGSPNGSSGGPDSADDASGRHSLAHELAAALLPEPSAGSKLLVEEFGIEYDEGASMTSPTPIPMLMLT